MVSPQVQHLQGGSWLKVCPVVSWLVGLGFLCDSKVNFPNKLKSELKGGCGANCIQVLDVGLFLNYFLSPQSRPVTSQWKQLAGGCGWVEQWEQIWSPNSVGENFVWSMVAVWGATRVQAQVKFMWKKRSISNATINNKYFWMTFMKLSIAYDILGCSVFTFIMLLSQGIDLAWWLQGRWM